MKEKKPRKAIHILIYPQGPKMRLKGNWTFIELIHALNHQVEWVRCQLIDRTVQEATGYAKQAQEFMNTLKAEGGGESSQE